ncbi:MAG: response regulator transcription factor, partial [Clostridiales bacterium]|nr:response regulator transcription factor [Clostridiales bacterium]
EDDPMARKLMEIFISTSPNYHLLPSLDSAAMAELYCMTNRVDMILMDVCTAMDANGIEVAEKLKQLYPQTKIIIITSQPEYSYIAHARKIGVDSFWYKEPTAEALLKIMDRTMAGESIYPDSAPITRLGAALSNDFTERELEVLRELVSGKTDAAIAETLCLSVTRVKQHILRIREKTQFANRTELAVRARESGLVIGEYRGE